MEEGGDVPFIVRAEIFRTTFEPILYFNVNYLCFVTIAVECYFIISSLSSIAVLIIFFFYNSQYLFSIIFSV